MEKTLFAQRFLDKNAVISVEFEVEFEVECTRIRGVSGVISPKMIGFFGHFHEIPPIWHLFSNVSERCFRTSENQGFAMGLLAFSRSRNTYHFALVFPMNFQ